MRTGDLENTTYFIYRHCDSPLINRREEGSRIVSGKQLTLELPSADAETDIGGRDGLACGRYATGGSIRSHFSFGAE